MNVRYDYFDTPEQLEMAEKAVGACAGLFPWWAHDVLIQSLRSDEQEVCAVAVCRPQYRHMRIEVYEEFFSQSADRRARAIAHEIYHVLISPLTNWVRDTIIARIGQDDGIRQILSDECTERVEAIVEDLAISLLGIPTEPAP